MHRKCPIVSYHYGAGNQDELKNLFLKSIRLIGTWAVSLFVIAQLIATPLATLFVGYDHGLFALTRNGFRLYSFAFLINGFNIYGSAFFYRIEQRSALCADLVPQNAGLPDGYSPSAPAYSWNQRSLVLGCNC